MSKKILIAYANEPMKYSLKFIKFQALMCGVFDKVVLYSEKDLPDEVLSSPLFKKNRGGGYWLWKPYIIKHTLQLCSEDDIVCYIDSGCIIRGGKEWKDYFRIVNTTNALCFQYNDIVPEIEEYFHCVKMGNKYWTKRICLDYFEKLYSMHDFWEIPQIWAGFIIVKGKHNKLIDDWYNIMLYHPELVDDTLSNNEYEFFSGFHRHDQSILSILAWNYLRNNYLIIKPEQFHQPKPQTVYGARLRLFTRSQFIKAILKYTLGIFPI